MGNFGKSAKGGPFAFSWPNYSRFWPFSWPNFVRLENRQYECDLSLISMDGCGIYSSF